MAWVVRFLKGGGKNMYAAIAAILAVVSAFFYGIFTQKKNNRLQRENERLTALSAKKQEAIEALETWINNEEELKQHVEKINNASSIVELHLLYQEATTGRKRTD